MTRALEAASTKWVSIAFALVGLGFLTKMLQALLVLPAFGIVYLLAAPTGVRRADKITTGSGFIQRFRSAGTVS